ncbi:MAG: cytochrome c [Nitrospirae bacterium]|nr:cytochrome c [Nitrospirota bacterium]
MKTPKFIIASIVNAVLFTWMLSSVSSSHAADLKAGEIVYKKMCVMCHGEQGQGGPALKINDPKVLGKTDDVIRKVIADGGNGMPGYRNSLKPEETDSLMLYLRSWRVK